MFIDSAIADQGFRVTDKVFAKYKNINPYFGRERTRQTKIYAPEPNSNKSTWVIPKSPEPGPGSYKIEEATKKSQWPQVLGSMKQTSKNVCFVDVIKNRTVKYPGVGKYENDDKYHHKLTKDPNFQYLRQ